MSYFSSLNWSCVKIGFGKSSNIFAVNRFVNAANVSLNPYFDDGNVSTNNVTLSNNDGRISKLPSNLTINFDSTTFGYDIIDDNGNISYKQYNNATGLTEVYHGNANIYSYGIDGVTLSNTAVATNTGRMFLTNANATAGTGTLTYSNLDDNFRIKVEDYMRKYKKKKKIKNIIKKFLKKKKKIKKNILKKK